MERVYHPGPIVGGRAEVTGPEAHHLARVRRITVGEWVELFDGRGSAARGRVDRVDRHRVEVVVEAWVPGRPGPSATITLAAAVPKGDRVDWLVEKATELGVARLIPLRTERSVVDPRSSKLDRLRRLVVEACKQCGRDGLMEVVEPRDWDDLIASGDVRDGLIAHPGGEPIARIGPIREATIAVGPEGGFTAREVEAARSSGWRVVGLGPNLLRVETAALAASAALIALAEGEGAPQPTGACSW